MPYAYPSFVDGPETDPAFNAAEARLLVAGDKARLDAALVNKGNWSALTTYRTFDVVSSGGNHYVCILGHTNHAPPNATYWSSLGGAGIVQTVVAGAGIDVDESDTANPVVGLNAGIQAAIGSLPDFDFVLALLLARYGYNFLGRETWDGATTYEINDCLFYNGTLYAATVENTNADPPDNLDKWAVLAALPGPQTVASAGAPDSGMIAALEGLDAGLGDFVNALANEVIALRAALQLFLIIAADPP